MITIIRSHSFNHNHTITIIQPQSYDHNHTITIIQPQSYDHNHTTTIIQLQSYNPDHITAVIQSQLYNHNYTTTIKQFQSYYCNHTSTIYTGYTDCIVNLCDYHTVSCIIDRLYYITLLSQMYNFGDVWTQAHSWAKSKCSKCKGISTVTWGFTKEVVIKTSNCGLQLIACNGWNSDFNNTNITSSHPPLAFLNILAVLAKMA